MRATNLHYNYNTYNYILTHKPLLICLGDITRYAPTNNYVLESCKTHSPVFVKATLKYGRVKARQNKN